MTNRGSRSGGAEDHGGAHRAFDAPEPKPRRAGAAKPGWHRPLFRCGDSTVLSAVPLPRPAAHPLASAHASAVAPAASLDPLRPRAPNGQRMARHRCSTARRGSQHYDRCRGGNNQPPYRATSQDVQKTLNTNYNYLKDLFYAHLPPQVRDFLGSPCHFWARPPCHFWARHPSKRP